jgi:hypothetical protein
MYFWLLTQELPPAAAFNLPTSIFQSGSFPFIGIDSGF